MNKVMYVCVVVVVKSEEVVCCMCFDGVVIYCGCGWVYVFGVFVLFLCWFDDIEYVYVDLIGIVCLFFNCLVVIVFD